MAQLFGLQVGLLCLCCVSSCLSSNVPVALSLPLNIDIDTSTSTSTFSLDSPCTGAPGGCDAHATSSVALAAHSPPVNAVTGLIYTHAAKLGSWRSPLPGSDFALLQVDNPGQFTYRWAFTLSGPERKLLWKDTSRAWRLGSLDLDNGYMFFDYSPASERARSHDDDDANAKPTPPLAPAHGMAAYNLTRISSSGERELLWSAVRPYFFQKCVNVVLQPDGQYAWIKLDGDDGVTVVAVPLTKGHDAAAEARFFGPFELQHSTCLIPSAEPLRGAPFLAGISKDQNATLVSFRDASSDARVSVLPDLPAWRDFQQDWQLQLLSIRGGEGLIALHQNFILGYDLRDTRSPSSPPPVVFRRALCDEALMCASAGGGTIAGDRLLFSWVKMFNKTSGMLHRAALDTNTGKTLWDHFYFETSALYARALIYQPLRPGGQPTDYVVCRMSGELVGYSHKTGMPTRRSNSVGLSCGNRPSFDMGEITFVGEDTILFNCNSKIAWAVETITWTEEE